MEKVKAEQKGMPRPEPEINNTTPASQSTAVYLKGLPGATAYEKERILEKLPDYFETMRSLSKKQKLEKK